MSKKTRALCRVCGATAKGGYCSDAHKIEARKRIKNCFGCKEPKYRMATFKNGTTHAQQYCEECLKTTFVSKWVGWENGVCEKPEVIYDDFLTEAAQNNLR